jgi:hypothetical protein
VLISTANPAIILVRGVIVKDIWSEIVLVLGAVGMLIDIVIDKPHLGGILLNICVSVVIFRRSKGVFERV